MKMFKRKSAFTMAEILLALTIIGVIATLTLPSLSGNISGKQFAVTFRKELAVMNQAVGINIAEAGVDFSGKPGNSAKDTFDQIFIKRMGATLDNKNYGESGWVIRATMRNSMFKPEEDGCQREHNYKANPIQAECFNDGVERFTVNRENALIYKMKDGLASIIIPGKEDAFNNIASTTANNPGINCNDEGVQYLFAIEDDVSTSFDRHYCFAYIDVNGSKGPNNVVSCANADHNIPGDHIEVDFSVDECVINAGMVQDVYPVLLYGDKIVPATRAVLAVFQDELQNN